jgi:hypothetical protein
MIAPLCLAAPSSQPPKPVGSRHRREGLTATARAEQKSSCYERLAIVYFAARQRCIRNETWLLHFQSGDSPIVAMLELHLVRWIKAEPPVFLCDARRINLYPVRIEPDQGPSCNIARTKGLQGGWDPSLGRRLAATPPGGHASTLGWCMPLSDLYDLMLSSAFQNRGRRHHAGFDIAPQGDQKLACHGNDGDAPDAAFGGPDTLAEPDT